MKARRLFALLLIGMLCFFAGPHVVRAETDLGFKAIGGRIGYVDPESEYKGTFTLGAVADFGTFMPSLHWDAALMFWKSSYDWGWYGQNYSIDLTDVSIRSGVKYYFMEEEWRPYAGGGLGMHFFSLKSPAGSVGWVGSDDSDFQFYICGGVAHPFSETLVGSGEVQLDFGDLNQTAIQFNLIYLLGK
jgi:hypothetical protein